MSKLLDEMEADPKYDEFFRTFRRLLAESRRKREAGELMPMGRHREFSGRGDYDSRKMMEYW